MGTDRYPDLPTRQQMIGWIDTADTSTAEALVDAYTARVIAEHRDTEQQHRSDPYRCPSMAPSAEVVQCALDKDHADLHRNGMTSWTG